MGIHNENRRPLAWQGALGQMRAHGTRLVLACTARGCAAWVPLSLEALIAEHGADWTAWDRRDPCPICGAPAHYMASPGESTPFRPLLSGMIRDAVRRAFLRQFAFTKRDIVRIKALAAEVTQTYQPAALNDLDVPFRVGAHTRESAARCSGEPPGEWDGRVLVYWPMVGRELDRWRSRRPGPRKVP